MDPRPDEIHIADIAHALSLLCRFASHTREFYSVAQHSVLASINVDARNAMWALLHDAAEAYVVDVPRPLKRHLPKYETAELRILDAIAQRFSLGSIPTEITYIDCRLLMTEARDLLRPPPAPWGYADIEPLDIEIRPWDWKNAEAMFLDRFYDLGGV